MSRNIADKPAKVIALVIRAREFTVMSEQLKSRNVLFYPAANIEGAMRVLENKAVDYCLLSVDFTLPDVDAFIQKVENEFKIPVIAISELRDKKSMFKLSKVKSKNTLYSKATSMSIFNRIEIIRKSTQAAANSKASSAIVQNQANSEKKTSSDPFLAGKSFASKKTSAKTRSQKLISTEFKPIGDVKLSSPKIKFKVADDSEVVQAAPMKTRGQKLLTTEFRKVGSVKLSGQETKFSIVELHPEESETQLPNSPDFQKNILECLRFVLGPTENDDAIQTSEYPRSLVITISSKSLAGTFVIAERAQTSQISFLQAQLYKQLKRIGFDWTQEQIAVEVLSEFAVPAEIITAGVFVSGFIAHGEVAIAFYPEWIGALKIASINDSQLALDPHCLVVNTIANFDIYLHLRVNGKNIHYIKAGTQLTDRLIQKLRAGGTAAWVPRTQYAKLNEYILFQKLLNLARLDNVDADAALEAV